MSGKFGKQHLPVPKRRSDFADAPQSEGEMLYQLLGKHTLQLPENRSNAPQLHPIIVQPPGIRSSMIPASQVSMRSTKPLRTSRVT